MRVGASHKDPTRRWRYQSKTIILFFMDPGITMAEFQKTAQSSRFHEIARPPPREETEKRFLPQTLLYCPAERKARARALRGPLRGAKVPREIRGCFGVRDQASSRRFLLLRASQTRPRPETAAAAIQKPMASPVSGGVTGLGSTGVTGGSTGVTGGSTGVEALV